MATMKNVHGNTVDHIGEAIVAGRYAAGMSIPPEPILCDELGVSRTAVREAVKSLIAKGLVTTGPKVGTRVSTEEHWNWFDPDVIAWKSKAGITAAFLRDLLVTPPGRAGCSAHGSGTCNERRDSSQRRRLRGNEASGWRRW